MDFRDYANEIALFEPCPRPALLPEEQVEGVCSRAFGFLATEEARARKPGPWPDGPRLHLRALLNLRPPGAIPPGLALALDRLLWTETVKAGIVDADEIPAVRGAGGSARQGSTMALWQGDIVRLGVDAIVNAANSALLGCFSPLHNCIDNVIHSAAGPRLREDCATIMELQGHPESTGRAKITRAYNLPSRFVLHTVGPIVRGEVSGRHREQLASSYRSCLDLCAATGRIRTIAFCCISTGVFGFPAAEAAPIAVRSVSQWLCRNPDRLEKVIFNVFSGEDHERYQNLLAP